MKTNRNLIIICFLVFAVVFAAACSGEQSVDTPFVPTTTDKPLPTFTPTLPL